MSSAFRHQGSLALNAILAVTVGVLVLHKLNRASATSTIAVVPGKTTDDVSPRKKTNRTADSIEQPKLPQYAEIKSASDRRRMIIDQLRAMGVPSDVLGRVARVDFEVEWDRRFEESWGDMDKMAAVQLEMNKSKDAEMRAALGEQDFKRWDQGYMLWEAMNTRIDVTPAEAAAIYDLKKKLQQRQIELDQARLDGTMDDAEIDRATEMAYSELNQKMKALLGDERYAKSQQLDDAFVADSFRHELAPANPSDSQFQELFNMEKKWNSARAELDHQFENDMSSPDYLEKVKGLANARDQEYQRVLGAEAFDNLRKQQDTAYTTMKKYETLWGLDDQKIDYVYDTIKRYQKDVEDYQTRVRALQAQGQSMDWQAVNNNLQQYASQTQQALQSYLGQDSFNKLQRNRLFRWAALGYQPVKNGPGAH